MISKPSRTLRPTPPLTVHSHVFLSNFCPLDPGTTARASGRRPTAETLSPRSKDGLPFSEDAPAACDTYGLLRVLRPAYRFASDSALASFFWPVSPFETLSAQGGNCQVLFLEASSLSTALYVGSKAVACHFLSAESLRGKEPFRDMSSPRTLMPLEFCGCNARLEEGVVRDVTTSLDIHMLFGSLLVVRWYQSSDLLDPDASGARFPILQLGQCRWLVGLVPQI
ncbi:hypothetical protein BJ875DRAFT_453091 [Amylocarpus encephaloides]|uniref:Uncharacterized protein n=1 Tax=Amylocarpus encephaloides TaxID=45428 RepID=A0A9P7YQ80_9HELO|nr:hypothetical protein BJ875DRAFT_453091 [Amylocarpus encephaloides]